MSEFKESHSRQTANEFEPGRRLKVSHTRTHAHTHTHTHHTHTHTTTNPRCVCRDRCTIHMTVAVVNPLALLICVFFAEQSC